MRTSTAKRGNAASVAVLLAIMVTGLLFAGCGDDDDDATTTAALTEEEFLDQGNEICRTGSEEIEAAFENLDVPQGGQPTEEQIAQTLEEVAIPNTQSQIEAIGALTPPEDLQDDVDQVLVDAQAALDQMAEDPVAVVEGPDPFEDVNQRLEEIGLTECAG